jgi:hypothetical protein
MPRASTGVVAMPTGERARRHRARLKELEQGSIRALADQASAVMDQLWLAMLHSSVSASDSQHARDTITQARDAVRGVAHSRAWS